MLFSPVKGTDRGTARDIRGVADLPKFFQVGLRGMEEGTQTLKAAP